MQHLALIIRADGTVPIDEGHPHRADILRALHAMNHELGHKHDCHHHRGHVCSCSPVIKNWASNADVGRS